MVFWYAAQRFCWEFLKPYAPLLGPLNLFHLICLGLMGYAIWMLKANHGSVRGCPCPGSRRS
jgi:hypothetical protein